MTDPYAVKTPMRRGNIGKRHSDLDAAKTAAHRAAKRYGHAEVHHWLQGRLCTIFADGREYPAHPRKEIAA